MLSFQHFTIFLFLGSTLLMMMVNGRDEFITVTSTVHDENCFTQGLLYYKDSLFESCGLNGKSSIRLVNANTGAVVRETKLNMAYFAEGITIVDDKLFMLTWKNKKLFVFDVLTFQQLARVNINTHSGEGWGLTHDDDGHLIVSDGSDRLTYYMFGNNGGRYSLAKVKELVVSDPATKHAVVHINELEYVDGFIFANIWYKDVILKIDAKTGVVVRRFDLTNLYPKAKRSSKADCLNGIAFNRSSQTFLLTGKLWPRYFEIKLVDSSTRVLGSNVNGDIVADNPTDL